MILRPSRLWAMCGFMLMASPVLAHPGHGPVTFANGVVHPFSGLDHLLAMMAVGLWAGMRGGRARLIWPASFVLAMLGGYGLGQMGLALPALEPGILASVIVLGLVVATGVRANLVGGMALMLVFGGLHGNAHGLEAPQGGWAFGLGFVVSTMVLHLIGLGMAQGIILLRRPAWARVMGMGTALGGAALALAL